MSREKAAAALYHLRTFEPLDERDRDAQRKKTERAQNARIYIPPCKNPARREACLADPHRFMRVYFERDYKRPFGKLHTRLIDSMVEIAERGGKKSMAAPRGRGKTQIVKGVIPYVICAGLRRFIVPVSQTTSQAMELYNDFRKKCAYNDLFYDDFPEICEPVRALEGAPQRASRQHVDGELTRIEWKTDRLRLANIPAKYRGPIDYGGVRMEYRGLDAAIRGINRDGDRPDFVPIDEPETRESAKSLKQIEDRINALDMDLAGLAGEDIELAQVLLTTIQNDYCLSFQFTDPDQRPSWMPERFGWVEKWPLEYPLEPLQSGMWHEYIALRQKGQRDGDRYGRAATEFFLANRDAMIEGGELLADNFKSQTLPDGWETVHSAWQEIFNAIADTSFEAFCTEYQNDPPKTERIEKLGLTPALVQSRVSVLTQREAPEHAIARTVGLDIGDRQSHWTDIAWEGEAAGTITDYGIMETWFQHGSDEKAIELAILQSLHTWADEVISRINPLLVLIDSGSGVAHKPAVYSFCRERGAPFFPSKGWDSARFRPKLRQDGVEPFDQCWAHYQPEGVWLYNVNSEHWKKWAQQRFLTQPYGPNNERNPGSLLLFSDEGDKKRHLSFSHHITSEEERSIPVAGKAFKKIWFVKNRNNHWLDATALACAAGGAVGVKLVKEPEPPQRAAAQPRQSRQFLDPYGRPFVATLRK